MYIRKVEAKSGLGEGELCRLTMPVLFEDSIDNLYERLSSFDIDAKTITYTPDKSFTIISSEREPKGVFGYILLDGQKHPSFENNDGQFHRITYIDLLAELCDEKWLAEIFHTILHRIVKCETDEDLKKEDYVWFEFNGEPFVLPIRKVSDIYDNMFMEESKKLAKQIIQIINNIENASE